MAGTTVLTTKWKYCILVSLAMVLLSMLPQINLWIVRGQDWNGSYVSAFIDEAFYGAYVNALIDGRPRRNDPFGANVDLPQTPLPESLYSIQFVPAYIIALPARLLGVSVSTAFIFLAPLAALLASLVVFWLLISVTRDHRLAAAGTLFVLCLGGFFGSYGIFQTPVDIAFPVLPFIRRYEPALPFPVFLVFGVLVWRALTSDDDRLARISAILAGLAIAFLVFSYFYLWTAAVAWLGCIGLLWFYFRPNDRRKTLSMLAIIIAITAVALVPYSYLLSRRASSTDDQWVLVATRMPELFHVHEIIGAVMLSALALGVTRGLISRTDPRFIYVASLGLLPFVVFNQQVLTGKTLQAFHFEIYSVNYLIAIGVVITLSLFWKSERLLVWMGALSILWGIIAVALPARAISVELAVANDTRIPVLRRLKGLSDHDGTMTSLRANGDASTLVFSPSVPLNALLHLWTPHGTLIDITVGDCSGTTREELKRFYFMHLYYSKVDAIALREALQGPIWPPREELESVRSVVFGHARLFPGLTSRFAAVQPHEIDLEVQNYQTFINSFSRNDALKRPITYAVMPVEGNFDFTNLDRWYERDAGERVGDYVLYRLKLRG